MKKVAGFFYCVYLSPRLKSYRIQISPRFFTGAFFCGLLFYFTFVKCNKNDKP